VTEDDGRCTEGAAPSEIKEVVMQFALLIYQDANTIVEGLSEDELAAVGKEYADLAATSGFQQNVPFGFPKDATTVRVQDGKMLTSEGTIARPGESVSSLWLFEAEDKDAAIDFASRIPAARLGGAIEVRPVGQYW
jgi:hypothetical protein